MTRDDDSIAVRLEARTFENGVRCRDEHRSEEERARRADN
jgi:hypothetical protein